MIVQYLSSPSHGWLKVPARLTSRLDISRWSFKKGEFAYLEEDRDMGIFLEQYPDVKVRDFPISEWDAKLIKAMERF